MAPGLELAQSTQKRVLSAPIYLDLVIYTGSFPGSLSLKCKQAMLNIPQQSAADPILVGWKSKLELQITYRVLEMLNMGHMRCNSTAMAKVWPHGM